ncbi:MAG: biopolymer transporter ExbD [Planctomycetia bacterium]|nr:biopolymer transporter ExbD [Planctomycetia bacterium]
MEISKNRRSAPVSFNMTPMIDVVFLLIIFFLVASHFGQQESSVEVDLPKAKAGLSLAEQENRRLTVSLPESGHVYLGSREVSVEELAEIFLVEKNRFKEDFQIRIRAAKTVPFRDVEIILKSAVEVGIRDVQFAVVQ